MKKNTVYIIIISVLLTLATSGIIELYFDSYKKKENNNETIDKKTTIIYPTRNILVPPVIDYDTYWTRPYVVRQPPLVVGSKNFKSGGYYNPIYYSHKFKKHHKYNVNKRHFHKKHGYHRHRPYLF